MVQVVVLQPDDSVTLASLQPPGASGLHLWEEAACSEGRPGRFLQDGGAVIGALADATCLQLVFHLEHQLPQRQCSGDGELVLPGSRD